MAPADRASAQKIVSRSFPGLKFWSVQACATSGMGGGSCPGRGSPDDEELPSCRSSYPIFLTPRTRSAPAMSAETLEHHHGKHHRAYVNKTNELIEGDAALSGALLLQVVKEAKRAGNNKLFNNSAYSCGTTASSGSASARPRGSSPKASSPS